MKSPLKSTASLLGYGVTRKKSKKSSGDTGTLWPKPYAFPQEYPDFYDYEIELIRLVAPYTMTRSERIYVLIKAVEYIVAQDVRGSIVECGVWRGGSMMAVAKTLLRSKRTDFDLYLYDTFEGMTRPSDKDVNFKGEHASEKFERLGTGPDSSDWDRIPLDEVKRNMFSLGYQNDQIHFIKGRVEETIPKNDTGQIALLRLDTDWYESTKHEIVNLFPLITKGGVLIVDDYGHHQGARQAVDEYISENKVPILLNRVDYSCRIGIKL